MSNIENNLYLNILNEIKIAQSKNIELYPESILKELQDLTGIPYQQIKKGYL